MTKLIRTAILIPLFFTLFGCRVTDQQKATVLRAFATTLLSSIANHPPTVEEKACVTAPTPAPLPERPSLASRKLERIVIRRMDQNELRELRELRVVLDQKSLEELKRQAKEMACTARREGRTLAAVKMELRQTSVPPLSIGG